MILLLLTTGLSLGVLYWLSGSTSAASFALGVFVAVRKVITAPRAAANALGAPVPQQEDIEAEMEAEMKGLMAHFELEMKAEMARLEAEMARLEAEMKEEMKAEMGRFEAEMKAEMQAELARFEVEMKALVDASSDSDDAGEGGGPP